MRPASLLSCVAIAALTIVAGACAKPAGSSSPSPDATGAPEWKSATSTRFGYALEVPGHYAYTPATEDWPAGVYPVADAPYTDLWAAAIGFPTIDVSTQELPEGMTEVEFLAWLDAENAKICTVEEAEEVTVDGAPGRWQRQTCGYNS